MKQPLTDDEFAAFCEMGKAQRERVPFEVPMLPIVALMFGDHTEVYGLAVATEHWPAALIEMGKEHKPPAAVFTADIFLRQYADGEEIAAIRPREDPAATSAIILTGVARGEPTRRRLFPYAVNDDGTFTWGEEQEPYDTTGVVDAALEAMVQ